MRFMEWGVFGENVDLVRYGGGVFEKLRLDMGE